MLKWKDVDGLLLTEEATAGNFQYQVFWGPYDEVWYGRVMQEGKEIDRYSGGTNYKSECYKFCEQHAKKQMSWLQFLAAKIGEV